MVVPALSVFSFHDTLAVLFSYSQEFYILISTKTNVRVCTNHLYIQDIHS